MKIPILNLSDPGVLRKLSEMDCTCITNLGFNVLPNDALTSEQLEPGFNTLTQRVALPTKLKLHLGYRCGNTNKISLLLRGRGVCHSPTSI